MEIKVKAISCFLFTLALSANVVNATDRVWTGSYGDGNWNTTSNWSPTGTPGSTDKLVVSNGDEVTSTLSVNQADGSWIQIYNSGTVVNFDASSYSLTSAGSVGSESTFDLRTYAVLNSRTARLGTYGTTDMNMSNHGTWNINGNGYIGYYGVSNLDMQSWSDINATSYLYFGYNTSGVSHLTMDGSSEINGTSIYFGMNGDSYATLSGSSNIYASSAVYLGYNEDSYSSFVLEDSYTKLQVGEEGDGRRLTCGNYGDAYMTVKGGADVYCDAVTIANGSSSSSELTLTGSGSYLNAYASIVCGGEGYGRLNVLENSTVRTGDIAISSNSSVRLNNATIYCDSISGKGSMSFESGSLFMADAVEIDSDFILGNSISFGSDHLLSIGSSMTVEPGSVCRFDEGTVSCYGLTNKADIYLKSGGELNSFYAASNYGSISMSGGELDVYSLMNYPGSSVSGEGYVKSTNVISNYGNVTATGVMSFNNGLNNFGELNVNYTTSSMLFEGNVSNSGNINMYGALFCDQLNNNPGGTIAGKGRIEGSVYNNGGMIYASNGTLSIPNLGGNDGIIEVASGASLSVMSAFNNNSVIYLDGKNSSLLLGNFVNNYGSISGTGRISGNVTNNGQLSAEADTLTVGYVYNTVSGIVEVQDGARLVAAQGLEVNDGIVDLYGGRFDNAYNDLNNNGHILGHGTLAASNIYNNGYVGTGDGDLSIIADNFYHNGVVNVQDECTLTFFADVSGSGSFLGTGSVVFLSGYSPSSAMASAPMFAGDLTTMGELVLELGGTEKGVDYQPLVVDGVYTAGGVLRVQTINDFTPRFGDVFDLLDFDTLEGSFTSVYMPKLEEGLSWELEALYTTGAVSVVPEPLTVALLGVGGVAVVRRKVSKK